MGIYLQFDEEKRAGIERAWAEWCAGELNRPVVDGWQVDLPVLHDITPYTPSDTISLTNGP